MDTLRQEKSKLTDEIHVSTIDTSQTEKLVIIIDCDCSRQKYVETIRVFNDLNIYTLHRTSIHLYLFLLLTLMI